MSIVGPRPVAVDQEDLFRFGKYNDAIGKKKYYY